MSKMLGISAAIALASVLGSGLADAGTRSKATDRPRLTSTSVTLPTDYEVEYPAGPEVQVMNDNCRACHSPSMVLVQPPLSQADWGKIVHKMIDVYKAPIDPADLPKIMTYLGALPPAAPAPTR
ncbi:cytochrome c [Rhizorhabdus phycosphaerae]|uniref:cytochrome c n=1 Tax=Rhizorhabdus phycosphaerae TaxID=2711156 RepID=UPI0013EA45C2|nr:cytochrome c [Rhizorhabdus phycosphaerae]